MAKQNKQKTKTEKKKKVQEQEEVTTATLEQEETSSSDDQEKMENDVEQQLGEAKDKYLRLYSEFENYRRRTSKERIELISSAGKDVIEALLPVVDDFERAIKAAGSKEDEGVTLIYNKFKKILIDKGLKDMGTKAGDEFNDEYHEAVTQIPAPDKSLEGKIVDVIEPGYFMGEKVLRFAKVVVGSKG